MAEIKRPFEEKMEAKIPEGVEGKTDDGEPGTPPPPDEPDTPDTNQEGTA